MDQIQKISKYFYLFFVKNCRNNNNKNNYNNNNIFGHKKMHSKKLVYIKKDGLSVSSKDFSQIFCKGIFKIVQTYMVRIKNIYKLKFYI